MRLNFLKMLEKNNKIKLNKLMFREYDIRGVFGEDITDLCDCLISFD